MVLLFLRLLHRRNAFWCDPIPLQAAVGFVRQSARQPSRIKKPQQIYLTEMLPVFDGCYNLQFFPRARLAGSLQNSYHLRGDLRGDLVPTWCRFWLCSSYIYPKRDHRS